MRNYPLTLSRFESLTGGLVRSKIEIPISAISYDSRLERGSKYTYSPGVDKAEAVI